MEPKTSSNWTWKTSTNQQLLVSMLLFFLGGWFSVLSFPWLCLLLGPQQLFFFSTPPKRYVSEIQFTRGYGPNHFQSCKSIRVKDPWVAMFLRRCLPQKRKSYSVDFCPNKNRTSWMGFLNQAIWKIWYSYDIVTVDHVPKQSGCKRDNKKIIETTT